jgi:MFS superfamily sulfate permease-like transporter
MKEKAKSGLLLILMGILVSMVGFCFTYGYRPDQGFVANIYNLYIPLKFSASGTPYKFAFRFVLAVGVLLIFVGFVKIDSSRRRMDPPDTRE